mmetsp:Transcript_20847/g.67151  ORF Transcript_20847/g.67151 Transcript_20847/m.67151 type:complete len:231 (+) Transcript_20847:354-1046(+)
MRRRSLRARCSRPAERGRRRRRRRCRGGGRRRGPVVSASGLGRRGVVGGSIGTASIRAAAPAALEVVVAVAVRGLRPPLVVSSLEECPARNAAARSAGSKKEEGCRPRVVGVFARAVFFLVLQGGPVARSVRRRGGGGAPWGGAPSEWCKSPSSPVVVRVVAALSSSRGGVVANGDFGEAGGVAPGPELEAVMEAEASNQKLFDGEDEVPEAGDAVLGSGVVLAGVVADG